MGWLCYPTPALSCTLFLPAGADLSPCHTPKSDSLTSDADKNNKQTNQPRQERVSALTEHQSSTTAAARVCGWKNTSLWWQWAVGMCPHTLYMDRLSCPSLEYKPCCLSPPNHWLSLPATVVFALGLWKSEYVSLQHRKISAINEHPRFLQLCMDFQPEQIHYTYIFLLQTPHFKITENQEFMGCTPTISQWINRALQQHLLTQEPQTFPTSSKDYNNF